MALFTPNIYVLDYLNKTGQLTEEIRVKSTGYLTTGDSLSHSASSIVFKLWSSNW